MALSQEKRQAKVLAYLCGGRAVFGIEGVQETPVTYEPRCDGDRAPWVDEAGFRLPHDWVRVYPKENDGRNHGQAGQVSG